MDKIHQQSRHRVLYLSHGAGPMPLLGDEGHQEMIDNLELIAGKISKPSAIILVSAHWEMAALTITHAASPSLLYDYYGFPQPAYEIQYPAPGQPDLANMVASALIDQGIKSVLDGTRGFDHGMFVPLKIMYPEADVPCIQLSLVSGLDPETHIAIGKALSELESDNLLIIGSGFSFHNMRAFFAPRTAEMELMNKEFMQWLDDTCSNPNIDEDERSRRLINWEKAPSARFCHPREEHLLPLHVCYGAARCACSEFFNLEIIGKKASTYLW